MSGWYPSSSCTPLNGGGVCCCAALSGPVLWPVPRFVRCVAVSTAVMSCCCLVAMSCGVVQGEYLSAVFVWWGILRLSSPSSWWWVGLSLVVGGMTGWGGMVSEGRVL